MFVYTNMGYLHRMFVYTNMGYLHCIVHTMMLVHVPVGSSLFTVISSVLLCVCYTHNTHTGVWRVATWWCVAVTYTTTTWTARTPTTTSARTRSMTFSASLLSRIRNSSPSSPARTVHWESLRYAHSCCGSTHTIEAYVQLWWPPPKLHIMLNGVTTLHHTQVWKGSTNCTKQITLLGTQGWTSQGTVLWGGFWAPNSWLATSFLMWLFWSLDICVLTCSKILLWYSTVWFSLKPVLRLQ